MITCPECGQQADDGAKFCDRCGQGLSGAVNSARTASLPPLAPGMELKGGYRIVELISSDSKENRYRAERTIEGKIERFQLREQPGPLPKDVAETPVNESSEGTVSLDTPSQENPTGPHAKTADLKLRTAFESPASDAVSPPPAVSPEVSPQDGGASETNGAEGEANPDESEAAEAAKLAASDAASESTEESTSQSVLEGTASTETILLSESEAEPEPVAEQAGPAEEIVPEPPQQDDLGEVFGRVFALSLTLSHPAFQRALAGFANDGRVYLVYSDETLKPIAHRPGGIRMSEPEALGIAIQVCQAVSFANRRGLRVNDICPESVALNSSGRIMLTGFDYVSNDNELQSDPIYNDGYTAPEIYRAKKVDKRADVFSVGALLYSCLTGERLESESWREEAGPVRFYPPHVVTPRLEQAVRRALLFDPAARWPTIDAFKDELVAINGQIHLRAAILTDVGMVRELNEDSVMAVEYARESLIEPAQYFLYVVADGMGGAEAGEMASAIAVRSIRNYVENGLAAGDGTNRRELLQQALEDANSRIIEYQAVHTEARGMGSTAVSALIVPPEAAIAWVGDSRAYLRDSNGLRQITRDHSLVQRLIEIGQITPEEARHHEHKNVITRSLGARQSGAAGAEAIALRLKRGDRVMLCSDGLTTHVEDSKIDEVLRRHVDPYEAARELVVAANAGGGTDNISVVVIFAG